MPSRIQSQNWYSNRLRCTTKDGPRQDASRQQIHVRRKLYQRLSAKYPGDPFVEPPVAAESSMEQLISPKNHQESRCLDHWSWGLLPSYSFSRELDDELEQWEHQWRWNANSRTSVFETWSCGDRSSNWGLLTFFSCIANPNPTHVVFMWFSTYCSHVW